MLRFSANLNTMFLEIDISERFKRAELCGFTAFEMQDPYILPPEIIKEKKGRMQCDLLNFYRGDSKWGFASHTMMESELMSGINKVNEYNHHLNFNKLHVMSGNKDEKNSAEDQLQTFISTLKTFVQDDFLDTAGITGLIEPICMEVNNNYFLNSYDLALEVLKNVNEGVPDGDKKFGLLLDVYHLHHITKDVKKYLDIYYPYAAHIQISQDPNRSEPFCKGGVIDYHYVLDNLRQRNHADFIGLEYYPSGPTESTLEWMKDYQV